jgi:hypothetical protein
LTIPIIFLRKDSFELIENELFRTAMRGRVKHEHKDGVLAVLQIEQIDNTRQFLLFPYFVADNNDAQDELLVVVGARGAFEVVEGGTAEKLRGFEEAIGVEVGGDFDWLPILDVSDFYFRVEDVDGEVNGGDSAESLRDVPDAVVNVEVGAFAVDPTRPDKLAEVLDEGG